MALSVTSGIVVGSSGANSATETTNAIPVNLFGLASGVNKSGAGALAGIGYFSGADGGISLNVNISGGNVVVSVSGDVVLVVSGVPNTDFG